MINILFDHTIFQIQQFGGISRYFYELIPRLYQKNGIEIGLFQGLHINQYDIASECKEDIESYKGRYWELDIPFKQYIAYGLFTIPNRIMFSRFYNSKPYTIFHPTYYRTDLYKYHKQPIVITVHDMIHELYPNDFLNSKIMINTKKKSIEIADKIICVSNNTKKDLVDIYDVPNDKVVVVYHGNSLKNTFVSCQDLDYKQRYSLMKPYILYVGDRKRKYKNFRVLLESFTKYLSNRFDLVCFGGGKFNKTEQSILKDSGCMMKVHQLNGSDSLLTYMYKHAFCLVYPSLYEGFGIPILEAMGLECPVVTTNLSSIPEVAGNAAILFDPYSPESLAYMIESLDENISLRKTLIKRGLNQEQRFNWDKTANETLEVYNSLI